MNTSILHVPRRFAAHEWSGTETVVTEIARQQQASGYRPKIITARGLGTGRQETVQGIPVERFDCGYPFLGLSPEDQENLDKREGNLQSLSLFWGLMRERKVRLFHSHTLGGLAGEVSTVARLRRKPFVVSLREGVLDVPQRAHASLVSLAKPAAGKLQWQNLFGDFPDARRVLEEADLVLCTGQGELDAVRQHLWHDRIACLPEGVDCAKFLLGEGATFRRRHGISADAFLVMNISRVDSRKNQHLLVEAFARFYAQQPSARLVLIGLEAQPEYAARVGQLIIEHRLQHAVKVLPPLRHDDPALLDAYQACDLFVLPSLQEAFGIVVLEAWSAGKPVLASRVGGLRDLVTNERTGLLFDVDSPSAVTHLADGITRLAADSALRQRLAEGGQKEARARYDWGQIHQRLEDLYEQAELNAVRHYGAH